ncbi:unnamed protein product [Thlaspi arvense]|uniref:BZIP domain-containing protein n=1 Tax=Thlaspi arvense TaxID=13288 RepID=A0AAU9SBA6_THLAR|nr:unnamed protein product [Thlaspi arvense]
MMPSLTTTTCTKPQSSRAEGGKKAGLPPRPPRPPHSSVPRARAQPSTPAFMFNSLPSTPAPVGIHNVAGPSLLPPIPFTGKRVSGATPPPIKAHQWDDSDDMIVSGLNSLLAAQSPSRSVYPKAMEMSVGVESGKEVAHGESMDVDTPLTGGQNQTTSGVKRRAVQDTRSEGNDVDVGRLEFDASLFTESELEKILVDPSLRELAATNPSRVTRILTNRSSAARSKEKKAKYVSCLENHVQNLQDDVWTMTVKLKDLEREKAELEPENFQLKFCLDGMLKEAELSISFTEHLTEEIHRLKMLNGSEYDRSNIQPMDANMYQPQPCPSSNQQFPPPQACPSSNQQFPPPQACPSSNQQESSIEMGDHTDTNMMMHRANSSSATSSSSIPNPNQHLTPAIFRSQQFPQYRQPFTVGNNGAAAGNRVGAPPPIPPVSHYSQIPATLQPRHSRSMSQPSSFFSFDSLPPLNPSPTISVSVEERNGAAGFSPSLPPSPFTMCPSSSRMAGDGENLPPRKSHRRSNSDVTFGLSSVMGQGQKSPPFRSLERSISGGEVSDWSNLVKEEPCFERQGSFFRGRKPDNEAMDDVFTAYMNLDNIDVLNSFGGEDGKTGNEAVEEMESSRGSGTRKTNGGSSSDSEGESSASGNVKVAVASSSSGVKRRAGGDIAPTGRHYRSVSMDSCFMGKMNFGDESTAKLPPSSSAVKVVSPTNSGEGNSSGYSVEFGNSEFSAAEMKKIAADEKLAEIVMADPKRVKRILANRVSAARSKERKTRYMAELEHKVQTLQSEATTLSAQLTHLQRDSMGLTNQNSELKFRLQAMEQQAQLRDALSEKLTEEVQRLKLVTGEPSRSSESNASINPEMFQQLSISQLQHQQMQRSNQNSNTVRAKHTSNE